MFKKIVSLLIISMLLMLTVTINTKEAVLKAASTYQVEDFKKYFFIGDDIEDPFSYKIDVNVTIYKEDAMIESAQSIYEEIEALFTNYQQITSNFKEFEGINNIKYINNNPNRKIEITKELYDIILYAEEIKKDTDGYFDISIGKIIDKWKWLINLENKLTNKEFDLFLEEVKAIPVIDNGILLEKNNDKFFITIKDGVKLDLGALTKGYAVARSNELLKNKGFKYYQVGASRSSLQFGKKPVTNDFKIEVTSGLGEIYLILDISNMSLTTSGDTVQGVKYGNRIYHHIISPKTKMPEKHNRLITLIHEDAGYADALTTALFSMDDNKREEWLLKNGELEYILFKTNGKVVNKLPKDKFILVNDNSISNAIVNWVIISGIIVVAFVGFYYLIKITNKNNRE